MKAKTERSSTKRWYKWRTCHAWGKGPWHYLYTTRVQIVELAEKAIRLGRGYDIVAIKHPPKGWLKTEYECAKEREDRAIAYRRLVRDTLWSLK